MDIKPGRRVEGLRARDRQMGVLSTVAMSILGFVGGCKCADHEENVGGEEAQAHSTDTTSGVDGVEAKLREESPENGGPEDDECAAEISPRSFVRFDLAEGRADAPVAVRLAAEAIGHSSRGRSLEDEELRLWIFSDSRPYYEYVRVTPRLGVEYYTWSLVGMVPGAATNAVLSKWGLRCSQQDRGQKLVEFCAVESASRGYDVHGTRDSLEHIFAMLTGGQCGSRAMERDTPAFFFEFQRLGEYETRFISPTCAASAIEAEALRQLSGFLDHFRTVYTDPPGGSLAHDSEIRAVSRSPHPLLSGEDFTACSQIGEGVDVDYATLTGIRRSRDVLEACGVELAPWTEGDMTVSFCVDEHGRPYPHRIARCHGECAWPAGCDLTLALGRLWFRPVLHHGAPVPACTTASLVQVVPEKQN